MCFRGKYGDLYPTGITAESPAEVNIILFLAITRNFGMKDIG